MSNNKMDYFGKNSIIVFSITFLLLFLFFILSNNYMYSESAFINKLFYIINLISNISFLPVLIIAIPLIGGPIEALIGKLKSEDLRDTSIVYTTFIAFILIILMYPALLKDNIYYEIPNVFGLGLHFKVDMLGFIMASTAGILWLMVTIYERDYMKLENHRNRFSLWLAVTFGAVLGTIFAGDILTMFLFFEIMTLTSYMLVAHNQSKESMLAGNNYLYMGVAGGLLILIAIILMYSNTGVLEFKPMADEFSKMGNTKYIITILFVLGFGIKAGMLPLHIWLPKAHPVAPTPASALLSGILIKIGAFGLLRITTSFFSPSEESLQSGLNGEIWLVSERLGAVIIWVGVATMAVGVFMALQQSHMKKMLAYHSISQMGYIIMGIGVASYLGSYGAMGFSGSVFHIVNHALFKSLLFMVAGLVYMRTNEQDMYKLGGLWRKMPITTIVAIIAALGITGMPGFNGFPSKSMLHHGIVEAYEYGHSAFKYAEIIFIIVSAGTVCSFIKFIGFIFFGKCPDNLKDIKGDKGIMDMAMVGLSIIIVTIGLMPNYFLDKFILPAANSFSYSSEFINTYIVDMNFFNYQDISIMFWIYIMGISLFIIGNKYHLFHINLPKWLDVEAKLYKPIYKGAYNLSIHTTNKYEFLIIKQDILIYLTLLISSMALFFKYF